MNIVIPEDFVFVCDESPSDTIRADAVLVITFWLDGDITVNNYSKVTFGGEHVTFKGLGHLGQEYRKCRVSDDDFDEVLRQVYFAYVMR